MTALASNQWMERHGLRLRKYAYCCCAAAVALFFYLLTIIGHAKTQAFVIWTYEDTYWMVGGYLAFSIAGGLLLRYSGRPEWRQWTFVGLPASAVILGLCALLDRVWPWGSSLICCGIGWVLYVSVRLVYGKSQKRSEELAYILLPGMVFFLFALICFISIKIAFMLSHAQAYQLVQAGRIIDDLTSDIKTALFGIAVSLCSCIGLLILERKRIMGRRKPKRT